MGRKAGTTEPRERAVVEWVVIDTILTRLSNCGTFARTMEPSEPISDGHHEIESTFQRPFYQNTGNLDGQTLVAPRHCVAEQLDWQLA